MPTQEAAKRPEPIGRPKVACQQGHACGTLARNFFHECNELYHKRLWQKSCVPGENAQVARNFWLANWNTRPLHAFPSTTTAAHSATSKLARQVCLDAHP